jgi:hypothetical protein
MKTIPITVLADEGPMLRAYLSVMRREGLRPEAILLMVHSRHPTTKSPLGRRLPIPLRRWYCERYQEAAFNFWPRRLSKTDPALVDAVAGQLEEFLERPDELIREMLGRFRYDDYALRVDRVMVGGLRDPSLERAIKSLAPKIVLYTGGGIVPPSLISCSDTRFIHVHAGHLPHVRGADGVLWSTLVRGQPGASCFFMGEALDTGPVLRAQDYPAPTFKITGVRPDDQTLYRALYSYYDPLLRADLLRQVVQANIDVSNSPTVSQDPSAGVTYNFMHDAVRRKALSQLFQKESSS